MRVSVSAAGLPGRYAAALFGLAQETGELESVAADLAGLKVALSESADLRDLTTAPQVGRPDAGRAIAALVDAMGLSSLTAKFLGVLATNGRLGALPGIIRQYQSMLATHNGRETAEVVSAHPLDAGQIAALEAKLRARTGRTMAIDARVDPGILGGLVVRIGSEQIDSSVRTRLERLGQQMKGL